MEGRRPYPIGTMEITVHRLLAVLFAACWLLLAGGSAYARDFPAGSVCHIYVQPGETYASASAHPEKWDCDGGGWRILSDEALVRYDLRGRPEAEKTGWFVTRAAPFRRITLTAMTDGGESRSASWTPGTMQVAPSYAGEGGVVTMQRTRLPRRTPQCPPTCACGDAMQEE